MWKHVIIDDFLNKEHFDHIVKTFDTKPIKDGKPKVVAHSYSIYENTIAKTSNFRGNIESEKFTDEFVMEMHNTYTPRLMKLLEELAPEKVKLYKRADLIFTVTPKNKSYPMHTDIDEKLLSVVIYLHPEKNTGTILYEKKDGKNPRTVEWKKNRALIFSRTNSTWHSYQGDGINDRYVLVYNLVCHPPIQEKK